MHGIWFTWASASTNDVLLHAKQVWLNLCLYFHQCLWINPKLNLFIIKQSHHFRRLGFKFLKIFIFNSVQMFWSARNESLRLIFVFLLLMKVFGTAWGWVNGDHFNLIFFLHGNSPLITPLNISSPPWCHWFLSVFLYSLCTSLCLYLLSVSIWEQGRKWILIKA